VTLLPPLMDRLEDMLEREGRKELAQQCFKVIPVRPSSTSSATSSSSSTDDHAACEAGVSCLRNRRR